MTSSSNRDKVVSLSAGAGEVIVDFVGGKLDYRRKFGGGKNQALSKAVGLHKAQSELRIFDATAGLGRDCFVLACLGAKILACERHPQVHAALQDGLRRALKADELKELLADKISLINEDAIELLSCSASGLVSEFEPDVIYLDPMHPPQKKTALAKKDMRIFREIVGSDDDQIHLLKAALSFPVNRVVVKRPAHAKPLIEGVSHAIKGKTTRFDVYMAQS
ncbi:MAG: class I SAM-dependent methyltransferase [Planctomycetes bacterium]|nr:class I SAM-dependent methyltransferase [Planctomycetota bacterium]